MTLKRLRQLFPWPAQKPAIEPQWHGWLAPLTCEALVDHCPRDAKLIVECGSWAGLSAKFFLEHAPDATVICIDHWCQTPQQIAPLTPPPEAVPLIPVIYDLFCANHWENQNRIIPMRLNSYVGLMLLVDMGLQPDLIYLDSDHSTKNLHGELLLCGEFPEARVVGDDYTHQSVRDAVALHESQSSFRYAHNEVAFWRLP